MKKTLRAGRLRFTGTHPELVILCGRSTPLSPSLTVRLAPTAALILLLLSACGSNPPVVSGDLSCERFRHISATQAQIDVIAASYAVMESWVDQIASHNDTYDAACITPASDPRGKSK